MSSQHLIPEPAASTTFVESTLGRMRLPLVMKLTVILASVFLLVFALLFCLAWWVATTQITSQRVEDHRPCALTQNGLELTGERRYSYRNHQLYGYHWHAKGDVTQTTTVKVPFAGMTVVAIMGAESTVLHSGQGEGGQLVLPLAEHYVFFTAGKAAAVTYAQLCK